MESGELIDLAASERILRSAREQIAAKGILGLRVADVAAAAYSSVTQIYRYFGSREGLLARVLGDIYEEQLDAALQVVLATLGSDGPLTLDDIVRALPSPTDEALQANSEIRIQILAVSVNNEELRDRLRLISQQQVVKWERSIEVVLERLPVSERFDPRIFTMNLVMQMAYYRKLLGSAGFSEEEYREYLRDLLRSMPQQS
jgi:AcrR family transcriptional regulator